MSTVINSNIMATRTGNIYNRNNNYGNAALTRITTGQRINSAKDGASTWAISERHRDRINANDQANRNAQNDAALLKVAQGGLENTLDILRTLKERAVDSANDTNVNLDRSAIATEVRSLVNQIDENATTVKYNGRALLNGAADSTAAVSDSGAANGVTATSPRGVGAVYALTNLKKAGSYGLSEAISNATEKLVNLVDSGGNKILQKGDVITLSWKENGQAMTKNITVSDSNTVAALVGSSQTATGAWVSAGGNVGSAKDQNYDQLTATSAGYYFSGTDAKIQVTDFAISVSRTENGITSNVAAAQDALQVSPVQQSFGKLSGSNAIFELGNTLVGIDDANDTASASATKFNGMLTGITIADGDTIKFSVDNKSISVSGSDNIDTANKRFAEAGMNVRLQLASKGDVLKYDGAEVMRGSADNQGAARSGHIGLYLIGGSGEDVTSVSVSVTLAAASGTAPTINSKKEMNLDSGNTGGASNMLPQGSALQFHIGGDKDLSVSFSIGKATAANLLGSSADAFAGKFMTSAGANSAISVIDNAITKTLNEQTRLGAMESRLGYTSDNLTTMNTNLKSADSVMRDSDIAKEMTEYVRYTVLSQASQYMMAQLNQSAFQVLNLLQL